MRCAALLGALSVMPGVSRASAQTNELDEGSFRLLLAGREVGSESFWIREHVGADRIQAHAKITLDTAGVRHTVDTQIEVESGSLRLLAYDVRTDFGESLHGSAASNRFRVRYVSAAGDVQREYLMTEPSLLADRLVVHHYTFLARRVKQEPLRLNLLIPRENRQVRADVTVTTGVSVDVAGTTVSARRLRIVPEGGDERLVWVDDANRILRMEVPSRQFTAERTSLPQ